MRGEIFRSVVADESLHHKPSVISFDGKDMSDRLTDDPLLGTRFVLPSGQFTQVTHTIRIARAPLVAHLFLPYSNVEALTAVQTPQQEVTLMTLGGTP